MNIGKELKSARTKLGLDVKDIEEAIKIRARFIEAMEKNDFDQLPGAVYVKGFLRCYATYLKIDPVPVVEAFKKIEPKDKPPLPVVEKVEPGFALESNKKPKLKHFTVPAAVMTVIFFMTMFLAYLGYQDSLQSQRLNDKKYVDKELRKLEHPAKKKKHKKKHKKENIDPNLLEIKIVALRNTWVKVKIKNPGSRNHNRIVLSTYFEREKSQTFKTKEPLKITASKGSYLKVYQNGKLTGALSKTPTYATKIFQKEEPPL